MGIGQLIATCEIAFNVKATAACLSAALLFAAVACGCKPQPAALSKGEDALIDARDGQAYRTVKIGNLVWMAENLAYKTDSSWCHGNYVSNCQIYGRLYAWEDAMQACPRGWRLPDTEEWVDLIEAAGGSAVAGKQLKSKEGWEGEGGNGEDALGFSALPGGERGCFFGDARNFDRVGRSGYWWSTKAVGYFRDMAHYLSLSDYTDRVYTSENETCYYLSVRCVRGNAEKSEEGADGALVRGTYTDVRDGRAYKTVNIGKKMWMAENLSYNADSSLCYGNEESLCSKYGRTYTYKAAIAACPAGWHLSSREEWGGIVLIAGGSEVAGKKLKSKNGWGTGWSTDREKVHRGTDDYGFSAIGGGYSDWWSATEYGAGRAYYRHMSSHFNYAYEDVGYKGDMRAVRCVSDTPVEAAEDIATAAPNDPPKKSDEPCAEWTLKAAAERRKSAVKILLPSYYRLFDECDLDPANEINSGWVSLYADAAKNYYIKQAEYYVGDVYDECAMVRSKNLTSKDDVLLFMKGPHFKKGKVDHIKIEPKGIAPNDTMRFEFNGAPYYFRATGDIPDTARGDVENYKLYVGANEGPEELLLDIKGFYGAFMRLLFIGDLDGDGMPDFIFDTSTWYESESVALFLSTMAEAGKIAGRAVELTLQHDC